MKRFLKLVDFELNRFIKIYVILAVITIVSQIIGVIVNSKFYLRDVNQAIHKEGMSKTTFLDQFGAMSLDRVGTSLWFLGPIALSVVVLIIYVFFIWYRDWFAKNTFIYRLLMLPTARLNVYLAKATTIFLMVLGLVALQFVLIPIESKIMQWMVPFDFRLDLTVSAVLERLEFFDVLFPPSIVQFLHHYGIGFMAVFITFTIILFERSFKWKGILIGGLYGIASTILYMLPNIIQEFILPNYFYPMEMFVLDILVALVVTLASITVSHYLLNKKITV